MNAISDDALRAAALVVRSRRHHDAGEYHEAVATAAEAAYLYGELVPSDPTAYLPLFADSLNRLGIRLSLVGRRDEAVRSSRIPTGTGPTWPGR